MKKFVLKDLIHGCGASPSEEKIEQAIENFLEDVTEIRRQQRVQLTSGCANHPMRILQSRLDHLDAILFGDEYQHIPPPMRWLAASTLCYGTIPWLKLPAQSLYNALHAEKTAQIDVHRRSVAAALDCAQRMSEDDNDSLVVEAIGALREALTTLQ